MSYVLTFLEGIMAFLSPCVLPLLPVYLSFFFGQNKRSGEAWANALSFVFGFTLLFTAMGFLAGQLGALSQNGPYLRLICGFIIVLFGLIQMDVIRIPVKTLFQKKITVNGIVSAMIFGFVYALSLTPCVGVFLGSALMMAAQSSSWWRGALHLSTYALGMGLPFILSALVMDTLADLLKKVKAHYEKINLFSGLCLVILGVMMMSGLIERLMF